MRTLEKRTGSFFGTLVLSVLLLSVVTGCQSIDTIEYPDAEGRWKYTVVITKPDTDNEGRRAYLFYRGKELLSHFGTIIIGETKYDYKFRINPWDFSGYAKDPEYSPLPLITMHGLGDEEAKRGWYFATADQRRGETPTDWIWVKRENLEAFVDPDRLYKFINTYELIPKVEERRSPVQFRFSFGTSF